MTLTVMIEDCYNFVTANKATIAVGAGWFVHSFYPSIVANGGLIGVTKRFFCGNPVSSLTLATSPTPMVTPVVTK